MDWFSRTIPAYFCKKRNLIALVIFTAVFALVFINLYKPFRSTEWYKVTEWMYLVYSSLLILVGVLVVAISRLVMYHAAKKKPISYLAFVLWIIAEIAVMAAIYTILSQLVEPEGDLMGVMRSSLRNTALIIAIPYVISMLVFSLQEYSAKLKAMDELQIASREAAAPPVISFYDSKGEMKLSIKHENLLYIEACDNYADIRYMNKGKLEHYLLRNSLKNLETAFPGSRILRCHRSFMVNFENVSLIRREKDGTVFIVLGFPGVPDIPVSTTYAEAVTNAFLQ